MGRRKIDTSECKYPNCFECVFADCVVSGIFKGEMKKNALCGELPYHDYAEHKKKQKQRG